jgi:hypothetical protein
MTTELQQAIAAIRAGDKESGRQLLAGVLQADPCNETAWLWMSAVVDSDEQRRTCLERVLAINPNNEPARRGLERLDVSQSPLPVELQPSRTSEASQELGSLDPLQVLRALDVETTKKCPYCAETIKAEAIVCGFCGRDLQTDQQSDVLPPVHQSHRHQQSTTGLYTPQDYASRIRNILGDLMAGSERRTAYLTCRTVEEVTQRLNEMRLMQKELRLLKKDVNLTMRQIRSSFTAKRAEIGKPGFTTAFMAGLLGKKSVGKMNALNREALRQQERKALSPYESFINAIDEVLIELDRLKMGLEAAIARHKEV